MTDGGHRKGRKHENCNYEALAEQICRGLNPARRSDHNRGIYQKFIVRRNDLEILAARIRLATHKRELARLKKKAGEA